MSLQDKIRC